MELMVKGYLNKTSKIGVKYLYEHWAVKAYEDLLGEFGNQRLQVKIELAGNKLNLHLISEDSGRRICYNGLDFKIEHVQLFQKLASGDGEFQFVHVFARKNVLLIAKPFHRNEFITISGHEFINLPA